MKFVEKKNYIDGIEYKQPAGATAVEPGSGGQANMEH